MLSLVLMVSGCSRSIKDNDIVLDSGLKQFEGYSLETYSNLKYDKNYKCAFEFKETGDTRFPFEQAFYIWNNILRDELRNKFIIILEELNKMNGETHEFNIDFKDNFILKSRNSEILKLEKDRSTAIIATLLPTAFSIELNSLKNGINLMIIALETSINTSEYEIIELNVKMIKNMELPFNRNYYQSDILYGFEKIDEISSFILGTYIEKAENVNTGGNHILEVNNPYVGELHQGEYLWFQFIASQDGVYIFHTEGSLDTKIETYTEFNSTVICSSDNSGEENNCSLSLDLYMNQIIYLKVFGLKVENYGLFLLSVELNQ